MHVTNIQPLISVVLPTFNRAEMLMKSVESVLNQSYQNLELIIVDDASTDATSDVLAAITDPRVRIVSLKKNSGGAIARNAGAELAKGEFIAFQDSDDQWTLDKLRCQVAELLKSGPASIVYCFFSRGAGKHRRDFTTANTGTGERIVSKLLFGNFVTTPALILPLTLFKSIGGFDPDLPRYQDWDLVLRLAIHGAIFRCIPEKLIVVNDTGQGISTNVTAERNALDILLNKHAILFQNSPKALAKWEHALGKRLAQAGYMREAFIRLWSAWRNDPYSIRYAKGVVASLFQNERFYRKMSDLQQRVRKRE